MNGNNTKATFSFRNKTPVASPISSSLNFKPKKEEKNISIDFKRHKTFINSPKSNSKQPSKRNIRSQSTIENYNRPVSRLNYGIF